MNLGCCDSKQSRLSRPIWPNNYPPLVGMHLPINVVENGLLIPKDCDVIEIKDQAHDSSLEDSDQPASVDRCCFEGIFSPALETLITLYKRRGSKLPLSVDADLRISSNIVIMRTLRIFGIVTT